MPPPAPRIPPAAPPPRPSTFRGGLHGGREGGRWHLLEVDPKKRYTPTQVLAHPWIKTAQSQAAPWTEGRAAGSYIGGWGGGGGDGNGGWHPANDG